MLLCIDCGNTRLKWGLHDGRRWLAQGMTALNEIDQLPRLLAGQPCPTRAFACNVASETTGAAIEMAAIKLGLELVWAESCAAQCGVKNGYDNPAQLGADRWMALIGARHLHHGACLSVNAGTATTVDLLDAEGVFQGGLILPGVNLMQVALARDTARLPLATGRFSRLPRNTADAIVSGALLATAGAITRMFEQLAPNPDAICLLSGGAAGLLEPLLNMPLRRVDNLVLEGLSCFAMQTALGHG
ncbi:MAG: type III pantothenate kinase [Sterolibacterium sp.]